MCNHPQSSHKWSCWFCDAPIKTCVMQNLMRDLVKQAYDKTAWNANGPFLDQWVLPVRCRVEWYNTPLHRHLDLVSPVRVTQLWWWWELECLCVTVRTRVRVWVINHSPLQISLQCHNVTCDTNYSTGTARASSMSSWNFDEINIPIHLYTLPGLHGGILRHKIWKRCLVRGDKGGPRTYWCDAIYHYA